MRPYSPLSKLLLPLPYSPLSKLLLPLPLQHKQGARSTDEQLAWSCQRPEVSEHTSGGIIVQFQCTTSIQNYKIQDYTAKAGYGMARALLQIKH